MDQVIVFDKSFQQRLQEYNDILAGYDVIPVSSIAKEWSFYLDLTVDPKGWQAIWKVQRKTCEALGIPFPSVVLVLVVGVELEELTALVRVLAVQDDIHLPDKHRVSLTQLWPTKDQDKSIGLNLQSTANALDVLRFFYTNLLMPWDRDDDDTVDWKTKHLETRLQLYYDMKNGVIPRPTAEHLRGLISEAKRLQAKREYLEAELDDLDDLNEQNINNSKVQDLMELHIRMIEIKGEVDVLENPLLRNVVIKKCQQLSLNDDDTKQNIWVIYNHGTAKECIQFLSKIEQDYPNDVLKFSPNLYSTLECANPNDIYILNESSHEIKTTGALEHGGILKGISSRENTILTSNIEDMMLDCRGDTVLVENITIEAISPQCAIVVRRGQLTLNNCKLIGDGKSSTHQGIIVLSGAKLEIVSCDISNFYTAIVGNSGSNIVIENSEIHDCNFGIKIYDNCAMTAAKATIRNCKDYGICVETENNLNENGPKVGNFDTLNIIPKLEMEFIKGNNNLKGDAVINPKPKLKPLEDLFENGDSDPTICVDSDEEMDTQHNETVIENVCNGRASPATV
ncbi:SHC SH2 domain-binding protein 1 [Asbolus verrucosus]|uniref:SHC SH2 domain-binding protein 1 n=1 Tax=Asbolus verrucosus TaxID=1661398 RepID=A0A482VE95_ASBVE|nr:SHC SH2 domain-binding protein 1 [Asbolus verrucosus]